MEYLKYIFVFFALALFLPTGEADNRALIQRVCDRTSNSSLCFNTLIADRRSSSADTTGLILILIDTVKARFTNTMAIVNKMSKKPQPSPVATSLEVCVEGFKAALDDHIPRAKERLPVDPHASERSMNAIAGASEICEEALARTSGPNNFKKMMTDQARILVQISTLAASAIKILE